MLSIWLASSLLSFLSCCGAKIQQPEKQANNTNQDHEEWPTRPNGESAQRKRETTTREAGWEGFLICIMSKTLQ